MTTRAEDVKAKLQDALSLVRELQEERDYLARQYEAVYVSLGKLGEALGHANCARPESPAVLMAQWTEEVRLLVIRHEPERLDRLSDSFKLK